MARYGMMAFVVIGSLGQLVSGSDVFEQPPINYSQATPDNSVSRLQDAIECGEVQLQFDPQFGYLPDLLSELEIPLESQMLVFSKTSLQRNRITPRSPRAIYFRDDAYIGFCHDGEKLEISAADPQLGTVFYTLEQSAGDAPQIVRQTESCLQCHGTSQTDNIPGHTVRSLFVDAGGLPLLGEGTRRVDTTTPIEERWGGWYVTGTHGTQTHQGNQIIRNVNAPKPWSNEAGQNVTDLTGRFRTDNYLTPHSDLVALLVFEHQTHVHNLLTQASFTTRQALHYETGMNKALGEPENRRLESTTRRIESAGEKLVQGLLFADEAPLKGPFAGTSGFAAEFSDRGRRDRLGRSLRDFDLNSRLFRYPCSHLIYSRQFDELPSPIKEFVVRRLNEVLDGKVGDEYAHLSAADRVAISEILQETKPDVRSPSAGG
jgi:hypothetical protein